MVAEIHGLASISPMWNGFDPFASGGLHSPLQLDDNEFWYDVFDVSSMLNAAGAVPSSGDAIKLVSDKSGNSAVNCLVLNGVAGNSASTPDAAANRFTTAIDIKARLSCTWSNATAQAILAKFGGGGAVSWMLRKAAGGNLAIFCSDDGTNSPSATSSAAVGFSDLATGWVRATWRTSDERVQFFTAPDQSSVPTSWTQLGTDQTLSGAIGNLFNSAAGVYVGIRSNNATDPLGGKVFYAQASGSIDGAAALVFDPSGSAKLATSVVASTGETWTINTTGATGARISGARDLFQGTAANLPVLTISPTGNYLTFDGSNDYLKSPAFALAQPVSGYGVISQVSWTSTDVLFDGNTPSVQIGQLTSTPRLGVPGGSSDTFTDALAIATNGVLSWVWAGASSLIRVNRLTADTGTGPTTAPNGITIGGNGSGAQNANITFSGALGRSVADDATMQLRIINMLARYYKVTL